MDVSSIRKINAMSQELKQFGFYDDSTTAVEGAAHLYSTDDSASKIFSTEDQLLEELKNSFSRFKDRSQAQMDDMRRNVETLTAQVSLLQQSLSNLQNQRNSVNHNVPATPKQEQPVSTPTETHSQERRSEAPKQEKPYYEKQGHFTSDDVKIEDIFYFGQR